MNTGQVFQMSNEYFSKTLFNIIKAMKCDIYLILNNMILGRDPEHSYIAAVTDLNTGIDDNSGRYIEISKSSLKTILDTIKENPDTSAIEMLYKMGNWRGLYCGTSELLDSYTRMMNCLQYKMIPDVVISNLKEYGNFSEILKKKAAEGASPLQIADTNVIYVYGGVLGINKPDSASLNYYKTYDIMGMDIGEFIINKKFVTVKKYFGYIPLI